MKRFLNRADLALQTLVIGQVVETKGSVTPYDGGGAAYLVKALDAPDGFATFAIANDSGLTTMVEILIGESGNAKQFGVENNVDATPALEAASKYVKSLSFDGLTNLLTVESPTIDAYCSEWLLHGATFDVKSGEIHFSAPSMHLDLGGGHIRGGNKLGQVAVTSGINTNTLILKDVSEFSVGDHIACSLDNGYLPNSTNRLGYTEQGDFNRITAITGNTLTMSYNFLRADLYTVTTGIIAEAWVGTNKFGAEGLHFTGKGSPVIENGTIGRFPSYTVKVEDGTPDGATIDPRTTKMLMKDILLEDTTIDIIWFRGLGITFDNVRCTQQKDFGKQFCLVSTPYNNGYVKYINGCNIARMNRDGETLPHDFGDQADVECGLISFDGTNVFSGEHDPDIPDAPDGTIAFYGANVPHSDSILAFHTFDSTGNTKPLRLKGFHSRGDRFLKYMWGIFATTSVAPPELEVDTIIFEGSYCECDPVFIKNPASTAERIKNNIAHFIGGEYHARVNFQVNQGVVTESLGAKWICPYETTQIPASPTVELKDFHMVGGTLAGGWRSKSSTNTFSNVVLAYANKTEPKFNKSLLISSPFGTTTDEVNFLLEAPEVYEDTGVSIKEYAGLLDLTQWIGFNQSTAGIGSNIKFRMYGYPAEFFTGSEAGFSKLYSTVLSRPTQATGLFACGGKWTKPRVGDYIKTATAPYSLDIKRIDTVFDTSASTPAIIGNLTVTLSSAPAGDETTIGIYDSTVHTWYYYHIANIAGSTVEVGASSSVSTGLVRDVAAGDTIVLTRLEIVV
jgi:hypothetical protein